MSVQNTNFGTPCNEFGEIPCTVCGFNEGMPGANMVHICEDCREAMREQTQKQLNQGVPKV